MKFAANTHSADKRLKSILSDNCTSLKSSFINCGSVASELEYNKENASLESIEITNDAITLNSGNAGPLAMQMANMNGLPPSKGNLKKHVDKLLDKHIKMMD